MEPAQTHPRELNPIAPAPRVPNPDLPTRRVNAVDYDLVARPINLVLVGVAALVFDVMFSDGVGGVGFFVFMCSLAAVLILSNVRRPAQLVLLACSLLLAAVWVFRESDWLRLSTTCLIVVCLFVALTGAKYRSLFDLEVKDLLVGSIDSVIEATAAIPWLARGLVRCLPRAPRTGGELLRIGLVGLPLLGIVAALLISSDPLIASFASDGIDRLVTHCVLFCFGFVLIAVLVRCAIPALPESRTARWAPAKLESLVVLGGLVALLAVFVLIQAVALLERSSLAQRGVDLAEHARSGYLQLLAVTAIVTATIAVFDQAFEAGKANRRLNQFLAATLVMLTLTVLVIACLRLLHYCEAFGLTMTRLACIPFALWIAVLLVSSIARIAGFHRQRSWLIGVGVISLVLSWSVFALANPQATIVRYDLLHFGDGADLRYLTSMSNDAVPQLVQALPEFSPEQVDYVKKRLCPRASRVPGLLQDSLSNAAARKALESVCR